MPLQTNPGIRGGIVGIADQGINSGLMQGGALGMVGLGGAAAGSPANQLSSDGITKSNGDTSSVSPVPYAFNGGLRGRRACGTVEKVVERRQRRMIKNRESAARSRARKQKCKVKRGEPRIAKETGGNHGDAEKSVLPGIDSSVDGHCCLSQNDIKAILYGICLDMPQESVLIYYLIAVMEMMNQQQGVKKRCLRRTQTGPW
ncbi:hypothetical protein GH714_005225 [Hevea brasiliensis]|uniref:BZIP domain-containing protein n=1 Tax=Hevea brasiliensis TaxID=3981 RepID=A0A6A6M7Y1_HEVBR|nr:hypothetical protein GH714_005225 [Hevea brasiliensis]